jgi:hypothetical protein
MSRNISKYQSIIISHKKERNIVKWFCSDNFANDYYVNALNDGIMQ